MPMRTLALVVLLLLPVQSFGREQGEVVIKVTPARSVVMSGGERSHRRIVIQIKESEFNQKIRIEWFSLDGEASSSERTLDGLKSQLAFNEQDFSGRDGFSLPPGHYEFTVTLFRSNGKQVTAKTTTVVLITGEETEGGAEK